MLSFNHPRRSPFIRLVQFTPSDLDTGAVKPLLGQLAETELTEAGMGQGICAEISPRSQQPSHYCVKAVNGPWSLDHSWLFRNHCEQSLPTWEKLNFFANIQMDTCEKNVIPPFSCLKPARLSKGTMSPNTQTAPRRTCSG
ncbi:hypothetical protein BKA70DRAFT_1427604 [Coprinopsis sp. MPI-PUGE-AT-0042]|nr:hypothetical protein BKA70DRAFT_1427604 [Coprinopsis sp. MPI-PUGE-AT-0042]